MPSTDPWGQVHYDEHTAVDLLALDHVALAVADPGAVAAFLTDHLGMHEIGRTADCIRVAADDRAAHLRLYGAEGPREAGALGRIVLRVADLQRAAASLPGDVEFQEREPDLVAFEGPEGLGLGLTMVAGGGIDYDLDHVVLRVADTEETRIALAELGCVPRGDQLHIADKGIVLEEMPGWTERPLLDHLAVRVESVEPTAAQARRRGLDIDESGDAFSIVLPGVERIRLDFVE